MAAHELSTNAVKYGALSTPQGLVQVKWAFAGDQFCLEWVEHGGPPATSPTRHGFGTRMIERVLAGELGGKAEIDYHQLGFRLIFTAPISALEPVGVPPLKQEPHTDNAVAQAL